MQRHLPALATILLTALAVPRLAAAQQVPTTVPPGACGVTADDGVLRAGGPDYSARFDAVGCEFTPLFGARVDRAHSLRWHLAEVRRGANVCFTAAEGAATEPEHAGCAVQYRRTADLTERYEVRPDGIEQKFVLAARPAGSGDLLVELAFASDLPRVRTEDGGLRFDLDGIGGVTFGALTGVDKNGATVAGRVHATGTRIVLSLPGSFVDHCAYPLVLDPLIGAAFLVSPFLTTGQLPAVAFDESIGRYLVVWNMATNGTSDEIRAQYVSSTGVVIGNMFTIATDAVPDSRPAVANVNTTNRFLVAWCASASGTPFSTGQIKVRSIQASSSSMSAVLTRGHLSASATDVSIGGDARLGAFGAAERALVVYHVSSFLAQENKVELWCVNVPSTGNPTTHQNQDIASTTVLVEKPSVTKHCGSNGNWLVVYARGPSIGGQADSVRAHMVDDGGNLCGTTAVVATGPTTDYAACAATEDGIRFLVAWEVVGSITVRRIRWSGVCSSGVWILAPNEDPTTATQTEKEPSLDFAGSKYVLTFAHAQNIFSIGRVAAIGLNLATGEPAGAQWELESTVFVQDRPAVAAKASAGAGTGNDDDEALVVWRDLNASSTIRARRFEAVGTGLVASLGGACGTSGLNDTASYDGTAVLGSTTFALRLVGPTSPIIALVVGFTQVPVPCGPCTLVPSLDVVLPGVSPTPVPIPLAPSLVDAELFTQWVQFRPSGCPILPDLGLSQALKFTIKE